MPELKVKDYKKASTSAQKERELFVKFAESESLTDDQIRAFHTYYELLQEHNSQFNLTAITDCAGILKHHFIDSLVLGQHVDLSTIRGIADIGAGAGFPGIPLKIIAPQLPLVLIETNRKKREFLETVCETLGLSDVEICGYDWRTVVRITNFPVDLFVSRAALPVSELCRMFKPSSPYKEGQLVYWASESWEPEKDEAPFIAREVEYRVGSRKRRLIFLKRPVQ